MSMKVELRYSHALEQLASLLSSAYEGDIEDFIRKLEEVWSRVCDKAASIIKSMTGVELGEQVVYVVSSLPSRASLEPMAIRACEDLAEALDSLVYVLTVRALRENRDLSDRISLLSAASGLSPLIFEKCISMYVRFKIIEEAYGFLEAERVKRSVAKLSRGDKLSVRLYELARKRAKSDSPEDFLDAIVGVVVSGYLNDY